MNALTDRLRRMLPAGGKTRFILLLGFAGMGLILLSGLLPQKQSSAPAPEAAVCGDPERYRQELESRLGEWLSQMEGVGTVQVMVTLSGSAEQVYAEEVRSNRSDRSTQDESAPVLARSGGSESALVTETKYPPVRGAAILCTGGAHAAVRERVTQAAAALLGIPQARIYVGTMNP